MAWPGDQPSSSGGGDAYAAQEPDPEEPPATAAEGEDELTPSEPFDFDASVPMAQEEETSQDIIPEPSPASAPIPDDAIPSAPVMEPEQLIQD